MTGRPTTFTPDLAGLICDRIAEGESLRSICEQVGMPSRSTVHMWLAQNDTFSDQYAHAREAQADKLADEIIEIADTATDASIARLRVDARKWAASKLAPKRYGDKLVHQGDPASPVEHMHRTVRIIVVDPKPEP